MANTLEVPHKIIPNGANLGDLLNELGVSADRVQRFPHPGTAMEDDFLYANERLGIRCELIQGTLVEMPVGNYESLVEAYLISLLWNFVRPRNLGVVLTADSMFRLFGGNIRMPDVAFIPKDRFPDRLPEGPIWNVIPSLAIEVLSASNTLVEMKRKRSEFFTSGVSVIWLIDPVARTVMVYNTNDSFVTKEKNDVLDGGAVLPGFSVALPELFSVMDL